MELNNITNTGTWGEQATRLNDNFNKVALGIDTLQSAYQSLSQSAIEAVDTLPQTGEANKIYRLVGTTSYSDYMYNTDDLTTPILMATYNNAIDNTPTANSANLVTSGGVADKIFDLAQKTYSLYGYKDNLSLYKDGTESKNNSTVVTDYIHVSKGDIVTVHHNLNSTLLQFVLYDSNYNIIDYWGVGDTERTVTLTKDNAAYIRSTMSLEKIDECYIMVNGNLAWCSFESIIPKIIDINKDIVQINDNINGIDLPLTNKEWSYSASMVARDMVGDATGILLSKKGEKVNIEVSLNNISELWILQRNASNSVINSVIFNNGDVKDIYINQDTSKFSFYITGGDDPNRNMIIDSLRIVNSVEAKLKEHETIINTHSSEINKIKDEIFDIDLPLTNKSWDLPQGQQSLRDMVGDAVNILKQYEGNAVSIKANTTNLLKLDLVFYNQENDNIGRYSLSPNRSADGIIIPKNIYKIRMAMYPIVTGTISIDSMSLLSANASSAYNYRIDHKWFDSLKQSLYKVPEHYVEHLALKETEINNRDAIIGRDGDSFIFITDTHVEVNYCNSPALIKHILEHTGVKKLFHGGDIMNGQQTHQLGIEMIRKWQSLFPFVNTMYVRGNHDTNSSWAQPEESGAWFTDAEAYSLLVKNVESIVNTNKNLYYYIDNPSQKIRYFFLDSSWPTDATNWEGDMHYNDQLEWLENKSKEVGNEWSILVIQHIVYSNSTWDKESQKVVAAFESSLMQRLHAKLDSMYDDPTCPVIIGVLGGHTHYDWSSTSSKGYPIIVSDSDSSNAPDENGNDKPWKRPQGTTDEQCFDVVHIDTANRKIYMTRVGRGDNREFSY